MFEGFSFVVCWYLYLEGLDRGDAAVRLTLVVVTRERALQNGSCVPQIDGFLNGNVPPVRHLNGARDAGDGEEGCVVFIMDLQRILTGGENENQT